MEAPKKQPAIPMMIGDYLKDPRLNQASLFSRGVWAILLMFLWEWDRRGEIETTIRGLDRLLKPDSIEEILFFLNEMNDLEFGDVFATDPEKELIFPLTLENCNIKVTVRNRKMYAEFKDRQNTRLRVQKHRKKKDETEKKRKSNPNVTPSLSVSVSITDKEKKIYKRKDEKLGEFKNVKITEDELQKLNLKIGENETQIMIERLSGYLASSGKKYKSHYATILNWTRKDQDEKQIKPKTYAQAQDLERRMMVKMLKESQNADNQESNDGGIIQTSHLLPHVKEVN